MPPRSGARSAGRRRRRLRPPRRGDAALHALEVILSLAGAGGRGRRRCQEEGSDLRRRRDQRRVLVRTLLDPLPMDLRPPDAGADRFWRVLRWGGAGLILAWWLGH